MEASTWAFLLFGISLILLVAELFLPSHGLLGLLATAAMVAAIIICFRINQYLGLGVLLLVAMATPFAISGAMKMWPKTPIGRRMMLQPTQSVITAPEVEIGAVGVAMSELRPMGTVDFDGERLEVRTQIGMIAPGSKVRVVRVDAGRVIVELASTV
jgi:membrane-bound ClpP family serine protease